MYETWRIELPDSCSLVKKEPFGSFTLSKHKYIIFDIKTQLTDDEFILAVEKAMKSHFGFKFNVFMINRKKGRVQMSFTHNKERILFHAVLMMHIKK